MTAPRSDVAIVGMAGVFPRAPDVTALWSNVLAGVDALGEPTDWSADFGCEPGATENDRVYTRRGGYLGDLARFDPLEFGVMPRSVDGGEPEHFVALRLAHDALADAGYRDRPFPRDRTGIILGRGTFVNRGFIGVLQHGIVIEQTLRLLASLHPEYGRSELDAIRSALKAQLPPFNAETAPSLAHSVMVGRIANRLDLMGPAYTIDAACASSLIAVQQAIGELQAARCDLMLAGGVQVSTNFPIALIFCQLGALSRSGRLRPFHPEADGTLLGEAAGVLVLKRRADAERDGDRIYAVIRGVGIASDGRAMGLLAPRVEGEELAMRRAYEQAGVAPATIGLVEAHGTGTPVGDATELDALARVFGERRGGAPTCALGSLKSMIGHSIPASGVGGLIKAALALHHGVIPPTLHADVVHPRLEALPFYLPLEPRPWVHGGPDPRRAAVSAFGFGGIDAHAILEEHVAETRPVARRTLRLPTDPEVVVLAAGSRAELAVRCAVVARFVEANPGVPLLDLAATLSGTSASGTRLAIVAESTEDLLRKLRHARARLEKPDCERIRDRSGIYWTAHPLAPAGKLAFLFPGEGAQYPGMLADVCLRFPRARASFDLMDAAFRDHRRGVLPSQTIFPPASGAGAPRPGRLWEMDGAVEAVFSANQALYGLLVDLGLRPDAVVGHSSGEYSALLASGATPVSDDAELIGHVLRGNQVTEDVLAQNLVPRGVLLAVGAAPPERVAAVLAAHDGTVHLAMDNCRNQAVVFGTAEAIASVEAAFRADGAICQRLPFDRAYHTPLFAPVAEALRGFFDAIRFTAPHTRLYSCVTAAAVPADPDAIRALAVAQWARPVRFRETVEAMYADGVRLFVEVGPRGNLTAFVDDVLRGTPHLAMAANVERRPGILQLCHLIAALAAQGVPLDLAPLYALRDARRLDEAALATGAALPARPDRSLRLDTSLPVLHAAPGMRAHVPPPGAAEAVPPPAVPDGSPAAGGGARGAVVQEYLRTMETFLATQEEVMRTFLARPGAVARPAAAAASGGRAATEAPETAPPASPPAVPPARDPGPAALDPAALRVLLLDLVSETTGYPPEMLDPTVNLEADLGIDSIKRVEILGALDRRTGLIGKDMEQVTKLRTLDQIAAFLAARAGPRPRAAAVAAAPDASTPGPAWALCRGDVQRGGDGAVLVRTTLALDELPFLRDHTLGGRVSIAGDLTSLPVLPLTFTVELLVEAAMLALPGRRPVAVRAMRAHRWLDFRTPRLQLEVRAERRGEDTVQVAASVLSADGNGTPVPAAEATVVLRDAWTAATVPPAFALEGDRPPRWRPEELYGEGRRHGMFHGPSLRAVAALDRTGTDGAEATLRVLPHDGLVRGPAAFALDPVLLDGAGQVLGYWAAEHLPRAFIVFPTGFDELTLHAATPGPPATLRCRVRIHDVDDQRLRADLECVTAAGTLVARVTGWEVRRIDLPEAFYAFRLAPRAATLGERLEGPVPVPPGAHCYRVALPAGLLDGDGGIWREALAHLTLGRAERATWRAMKVVDKRRTEWLLGRVAAKDAVRSLLRARGGVEVYPADLELQADRHGRPVVTGDALAPLGAPPVVSLAHAGGIAVAVAAELPPGEGIGIDCEPDAELPADAAAAAFRPDEYALVSAAGPAWFRAAWCAKEAIAKALQRGLIGGPHDVVVRAIDTATGTIRARLAGALGRQFPELAGTDLVAETVHRDGVVLSLARVAWTLPGAGGEEHDVEAVVR